MYLSDDNLVNDEENIPKMKRNRKHKILTVSPSSKRK